MADSNEIHHHSLIQTHKPSSLRLQLSRTSVLTRRRKVVSVRLGGKKKRGVSLVRLFRRIKLRWLKLQYTCMLRRLKSFYSSVVKDLIEAGATLETVQQRIMMEAYYTVPVMGVSVAGALTPRIVSHTGSNRLCIKNY